MTDAEVLDQALNHLQPLLHELYVFRGMVKELGDLKTQYDHTKSAVEATGQELNRLAAELAANKAELVKTQEAMVEKGRQSAALDAEIEQKQRTLTSYSQTIDRITGVAA